MNSVTPGNSNTAKLVYETHNAHRSEETVHDYTTRRTPTETKTSPVTKISYLLALHNHSSGNRVLLPHGSGAPGHATP